MKKKTRNFLLLALCMATLASVGAMTACNSSTVEDGISFVEEEKKSGPQFLEGALADIHVNDTIVLKEYIEGDTVMELVQRKEMKEDYIRQMRDICKTLYANHINIDYYPTNFVVKEGILFYVDYECNDYDEKWNFENWGIKYWLS